MLLQIATSALSPATDLGFLLAKNPARPQTFNLSFGVAHAFYSVATEERCEFALLLETDPIALVRGKKSDDKRGGSDGPLASYVNDRPYVASSFLSVAIADVLRSALNGNCKEKPELAAAPFDLEAKISVVPAPDEEFLHRLFEPLGYEMEVENWPLDTNFPDWGNSRLFGLKLKGCVRLSDLLSHIYVLVPVLDNEKHYFVGESEVEKLLRRGSGWLEAHPEQNLIAARYLKRKKPLIAVALEKLAPEVESDDQKDAEEERVEKPLSLHQIRLQTVLKKLKSSGARRVLDLGCGEGRLLRELLNESQFEEILGLDASHRALDFAAQKLRLERLPEAKKSKIKLLHGALTYRDDRLKNFDAAAIVEVVEHLDPPRLKAFERAVWEFARPRVVILTTPNRDFNAKWESLPAGNFRHRDHRFEWSRDEFAEWANGVAKKFGYKVEIEPLGPLDEELGAPSQMAIFELLEKEEKTDES